MSQLMPSHGYTEDPTVLKVGASRQASYSGDGIITTTYDNDAVVRGTCFAFEKLHAIGSGAKLYILIDYTTYIPTVDQQGIIFVLPPKFQTTVGPVVVSVYRGHDYAGGTEFDCINPNTTHAKTTSGTTFTSGATGTTLGTKVLEYLVGGASQGANAASGESRGIGFFIRNNTQKTLVEIDNQSGAAIKFHYGQVFFEI